jgi:hypothetical protein
MKQLFFAAFFLMCNGVPTLAQNLVLNGDFEQYNTCELSFASIDTNTIQFYALPHWFSATVTGTPDYFNECFSNVNIFGSYDVPYNSFGSQLAKSGVGYAGLAILVNYGNAQDGREHLQTKLTTPLIAGQTYCIGFNTSLGTSNIFTSGLSTIATKNWGLYLSKDRILNLINSNNDPNAYFLTGQPQIVASDFISDTVGWTFVGGTYTAQGGEQWLTIGNFNPIDQTPVDTLIKGTFGELSYYFLDDVFVIPQSTSALLGADTAYCASDFPVMLTANAGFTDYLWSTGETGPVASAAAAGIYAIQASFEGCTVRDTVALLTAEQAYEPLDDVSGCATELPIVVQVDPKFGLKNFVWSDGSVGDRLLLDDAGIYTFVADGPCAVVTDTFLAQIDTVPNLTLGDDINICLEGINTPVLLSNPVPLSNYLWSNGATTASITVGQSGSFTLSTTNGCGVFTDEATIKGCGPAVYVPNVFSPSDPDPQNHFFQPLYINSELVRFRVYDRWGSLLYDQRGAGAGWDGAEGGRSCGPGVYLYTALFLDSATGSTFERAGDILLVR